MPASISASLHIFAPHNYVRCNAHTKAKATALTPANRQEFPMIVSHILAKFRAYVNYRKTFNELSVLSDRELNDLGINRFQIDSIARQVKAG
jgi:uncharacterized protein YjiS (DUF1127 family)